MKRNSERKAVIYELDRVEKKRSIEPLNIDEHYLSSIISSKKADKQNTHNVAADSSINNTYDTT